MDNLDEDWLAIELEASSKEAAGWTGGLKQSYEELVAEEDEAEQSRSAPSSIADLKMASK